MKTKITVPLIIFTFSFLLFGCPGDLPEEPNKVSDGYKFSNPEFVLAISPFGVFQHAFITDSKIFYLTHWDIKTMIITNTSFKNNLVYVFNDEQATSSLRELIEKSGPFVVDRKEEYMYVIVNSHLYKCNLKNISVYKVTETSLGNCRAIKLLENNDIIFTTDLYNGSIQIIPSGKNIPDIIASNLGSNPTSFEVSDQSYLVTLSQAVGSSVKKISQTGEVTTIISDITNPQKIISDNHGNYIIQSRVSIDNKLYYGFYIYDKMGIKISEVLDNNDNQILGTGTWSTSVPLYIDKENRLYFGHNDSGLGSYYNPKGSGERYRVDIYKIQLNKQ